MKIAFDLDVDADGWPPSDVETMWASKTADGLFRLDNIPFYALGVADQDIVTAEEDDEGRLVFCEVVTPSEFSTVRVHVSESEDKDAVRSEFKAIGCDSEGMQGRLFAMSIPSVSLVAAIEKVHAGEAAGRWDWEEGVIK